MAGACSKRAAARCALSLGVWFFAGCEGPVGPAGPPGPRGPMGVGLDAQTDVVTDAAIVDDGVFDDARDAAGDRTTPAEDIGRPDPTAVCQSCHPSLDVSSLNLVAIHNPESPRYNSNCLHCHQDILNRTTLDPRVQEIHRRMLPYVGTWRGSPRNEDCAFCHRGGVDLSGERSAAGIRRQVPTQSCAGCHRDGRWDYYLP
jgi:hypothetical protein